MNGDEQEGANSQDPPNNLNNEDGFDDTANGVSVDSLIDSAVLEAVDESEAQREHDRPVVASFITKALILLFIVQAGLLTLAYVGLVTWIAFVGSYFNRAAADEMELVTEAILRGVQVILPVTTTLLGVAIGYYFKEDITRAQEELLQ